MVMIGLLELLNRVEAAEILMKNKVSFRFAYMSCIIQVDNIQECEFYKRACTSCGFSFGMLNIFQLH